MFYTKAFYTKLAEKDLRFLMKMVFAPDQELNSSLSELLWSS